MAGNAQVDIQKYPKRYCFRHIQENRVDGAFGVPRVRAYLILRCVRSPIFSENNNHLSMNMALVLKMTTKATLIHEQQQILNDHYYYIVYIMCVYISMLLWDDDEEKSGGPGDQDQHQQWLQFSSQM